jgi:hypothetical protein
MLVPARLCLRRTARPHSAPNVSLTSGRPCSALGLQACPVSPQATARRSTLPARSENSKATTLDRAALPDQDRRGRAEPRCPVKLARPLRAKLRGKGPRVAAPHCPQTPGIAAHYDPSSRTGKTPSGSLGRHGSQQGNSGRLQPSSTPLQEGRRLPLGDQCEARQATELRADRLHSALLRSGSRS